AQPLLATLSDIGVRVPKGASAMNRPRDVELAAAYLERLMLADIMPAELWLTQVWEWIRLAVERAKLDDRGKFDCFFMGGTRGRHYRLVAEECIDRGGFDLLADIDCLLDRQRTGK